MGDALAPAPRSSFPRYWTAAAISSFGSAVTAVAMPVLVVQLLGATPFEVGEVNAVRTHLLLPKRKAPNAAVLPNNGVDGLFHRPQDGWFTAAP